MNKQVIAREIIKMLLSICFGYIVFIGVNWALPFGIFFGIIGLLGVSCYTAGCFLEALAEIIE
jgi:hypothetical protein